MEFTVETTSERPPVAGSSWVKTAGMESSEASSRESKVNR